MQRYRWLLVSVGLLIACAAAQGHADNLGGFTRFCLDTQVLVAAENDEDRSTAAHGRLRELAAAAGMKVEDADICRSVGSDADTLKLRFVLQLQGVSEGGYAYSYDLSGLLDDFAGFSRVSVYRIAEFGFSSEASLDEVVEDLIDSASSRFLADWRAASGRVPQALEETSERIEGPTPNGGAYAIAYYRGEDGNPTVKAEAHSVEIVEYDKEGNAVHRTYGQLRR